jgi:proton glutamate symport protein
MAGRRWRPSLTQLILLALVAGIAVGAFAPEVGVALRPVGQLFLRLIKMLIGPLVLSTLVAGIAGAGGRVVGRMGVKAILWFEAATTVALFIGLGVGKVVQPGVGVSLVASAAEAEKLAAPRGAVELLLGAVPTSIVDALARNDVLQVVVFSIFLGLAVGAAGEKAAPVKKLAEAVAEAMFKIVGYVMKFAPLGVGCAMAAALGAKGVAVLLPLGKLVGALYLALLFFVAMLIVALKVLTKVHLRTFLKAVREPVLLAFSTTSSDAALPKAMEALEELGIPRTTVAFVLPAGYSFNLDGSTLYLSLAVMFVVQASGANLTLAEELTIMGTLMLSTKGIAAVPRASLVVLAATLTAFHLPIEGVAIILGVDEVMDMARTGVNLFGNCVATALVATWEKQLPPGAPIFGPGPARSGS